METDERIIRLIQGELSRVKELLDKGKGSWGSEYYIKDDLWASWHGQLSVLNHLLYKISEMAFDEFQPDKHTIKPKAQIMIGENEFVSFETLVESYRKGEWREP